MANPRRKRRRKAVKKVPVTQRCVHVVKNCQQPPVAARDVGAVIIYAREKLSGSRMSELYEPKQDAYIVMSLGASGKPRKQFFRFHFSVTKF